MSDYEDDMDVDVPAVHDPVVFSSDNSKGKRSAANLPAEAEDSLPWYEHAESLLLILLTIQG
jgi:replication factor C subunit 3/5